MIYLNKVIVSFYLIIIFTFNEKQYEILLKAVPRVAPRPVLSLCANQASSVVTSCGPPVPCHPAGTASVPQRLLELFQGVGNPRFALALAGYVFSVVPCILRSLFVAPRHLGAVVGCRRGKTLEADELGATSHQFVQKRLVDAPAVVERAHLEQRGTWKQAPASPTRLQAHFFKLPTLGEVQLDQLRAVAQVDERERRAVENGAR